MLSRIIRIDSALLLKVTRKRMEKIFKSRKKDDDKAKDFAGK